MVAGNERLDFFISDAFFCFLKDKTYAEAGLSRSGCVGVLSYNERVETCAADDDGVGRPAEAVLVSFFLPYGIEYRLGSESLNVSGLRVGNPLFLGIYLRLAVNVGVTLRYLERIGAVRLVENAVL